MADKRIDQLTAATTMGDDDLLVLQQNNQAKKLSGATLSDYIYDVVEVSNTQPTESRNKVWIKPSTEDLVLAEQSDVDNLEVALRTLNSYDIFRDFSTYTSRTNAGVTFTWNAEKTVCTASGTATSSTSYTVMYSNTTTVPSQIVPGETYYLNVKSTSENLYLRTYTYLSDGTSNQLTFRSSGKFKVASNAVGFVFRVQVSNGATVNNDTISVSLTKHKLIGELSQEFPSRGTVDDNGIYSADDVVDYSVYFMSANSDFDKFPFLSGYLITIPYNKGVNTQVLQFAVEWNSANEHDHIMYRTMNGSTWRDWKNIVYDSGKYEEILQHIIKYNCFNLIDYTNGTSGTITSVTYTLNPDKTWTINGTVPAGDFSFRNIINSQTALPDYFIPGRTYYFKISKDVGVDLQLILYFSDGTYETNWIQSDNSAGKYITIPDNTTGFIFRFRIGAEITVNNETLSVTALAVSEPYEDREYVVVNQEVHNDTYNNVYDISVSPTITTDTNGWLQPIDTNTEDETGKTDMTSAIMAMLTTTGYCHLAPGIYYVSGNIDMPEYSMIEGCGRNTIVRLLSSATNAYVFKAAKYNTIKDLTISGSYNDLNPSNFTADKGTRHGIIYCSGYDETSTTAIHSTVRNIFISNFTGCGIKCYSTGMATYSGLYAAQAYIMRCQTGIFVDFHSEFNKFEQINTRNCYIACENDGGNNMFIGCTFAATNTGFLIDNSLNDKANNAHGSVIGCTFCHIGSNAGIAIAVKNISNGFTFSNCQVWYCSILVEDSYGVTFSNMEFGRGAELNGASAKGATIDIKRGGTVMFTGCIFMNDVTYKPTITISNNDNVKFIGCYGSHSGNEIKA